VPWGSTIYEHHPNLVISTDFIKQRSRRDEFALQCPELVIVDDALSGRHRDCGQPRQVDSTDHPLPELNRATTRRTE
jgi:hypothetical protein